MLIDDLNGMADAPDGRDPTRPPSNVLAEDAVIGSLLKNPLVLGELLDRLRPEDFFSAPHRAAYAAAVALARQQAPIDYTTLSEQMAAAEAMSAREAMLFLAEVNLTVPTSAHAAHYAGIVARYAVFRRLISAAQAIAEDAWRATGDPDSAIAQGLQRLVAIRDRLGPHLVTPAAWAAETRTALEQGQPRALLGLPSGLFELDLALLGFVAGELYVLGARTSVGKTTLLMQIAHHVASQVGPVLFVSCEMKPELLFDRMLAGVANVSVNKLALRTLQVAERTRALSSLSQLAGMPLYVLRRKYLTSEIRDAVLTLEAYGQRPVLIVQDFVQMLQDKAGDGRHEWANYGEAAKQLKVLAEDFGVPVLAASQLNRESEYQKRAPSLADFSLSDQIVQYADAVFSLHREKDEAGGSRTYVGLLKRRNYGRPAGEMLELIWEGQRYVDPHPPEHYQDLLRVPMTTAPLEPPPGSDIPW